MAWFRIFFIFLILLPKTFLCFGNDGHIDLNYNFQEECCNPPSDLPQSSQNTFSPITTSCCIDVPVFLDLFQRFHKIDFPEQTIRFLKSPPLSPDRFSYCSTSIHQHIRSSLEQLQTIVLRL
ncbi:MAG: hypothetical protein AABZ60_16390 [Planctomycetota bacterium]